MTTFPLLFGSEPTEIKIKEFAGSLLSLGSENSLELARLLLALEAKYHSSLHEDLTEFEVFVKTAISVSNTYGLQSFEVIEDQFVELFGAIAL